MRGQPRIFVGGNCQVRFIAAFLEAIYPGRITVVGEPYSGAKPAFNGLVPAYLRPDLALPIIKKHIDEDVPVVTIRQATPMFVTGLGLGATAREVSDDILLPHVELYALWPEQRGLKDVDDKLLPRLLRADIAAIESSARKSTIFKEASEIVASLIRSRPSFDTAVHPRGDLMNYIVKPLLIALGGEDLLAKSKTLTEQLASTGTIEFDCAHPVSLKRLEILGFDWGEHYVAWSEGRAALDRGDFQVAYDKYSVALAGFPDNWKLRREFAQAAFGVGDIERGLNFLEWARSRNPRNMHVQSSALYDLLQRGMTAEAVFHRAAIALETHGLYAPLYINLAQACFRDRRLGHPEPYARKAYELAPKNEHAACLLARSLWKRSLPEAIRVLEEFVAQHGGSARAEAELANYKIKLDK